MPRNQLLEAAMSGAAGRELWTVRQAAEFSGRPSVTIYRWIREGRLAPYRSGPRPIFVDANEVKRLVGLRVGT